MQKTLAEPPGLLFAVLVGSQVDGTATAQSDWDVAVQWQYSSDAITRIAKHESLRRALAQALEVSEDKIDLIDLTNARLVMKALVAEEGYLLTANDELGWAKFLTRTWRELEDFYWDQDHAA